MKLTEFIRTVGELPVIDTEILLAGMPDPQPVKVQISRWVKSGKLIQLKRGFYLLAQPYRKIQVNEPYIASILKSPSYISLEKAMEYHGLIPEAVKVYTAVTTKRPGRFASQAGVFEYHHIKTSLFWGYESVRLDRQVVFIAAPEKALLDFFYLKRMKISYEYIGELRLENVEKINLDKLLEFSRRFKKPKILRAAKMLKKFIQSILAQEKEL